MFLVARTGLEPVQLALRDFKSLVSTIFTIGPLGSRFYTNLGERWNLIAIKIEPRTVNHQYAAIPILVQLPCIRAVQQFKFSV